MPMLTDFGFTPEQKMMRESLLKLARKELPPEEIRAMDEEGGWPKKAYDAMARDGWLGLPYPEEYGGRGLTATHERIFREEAVGYVTPDFGGAGPRVGSRGRSR